MKKVVLLLLLSFSSAHAQDVPAELMEERLVLRSYQAALTYYESFSKIWLSSELSDQHLGLNLNDLKEIHGAHYKQLDALVAKYTTGPDDANDLLEKLDSLGGDFAKLSSSYEKIAKADRIFITSMVDLANGVAGNRFFFENLLKTAKRQETKDSIQKIIASWDVVLASVDKIYGYLNTSAKKRKVMDSLAMNKIKLNLQARYAKVAKEDLSKVRERMKKILAASDLLGELEVYFGHLTTWGLAGRETYYNLYEATVKMHRVGVIGLSGFRDKVERLGAEGRVGRILRDRSQRYLDTKKEDLENTKRLGWRDFHTTQLALAADTLGDKDSYTEKCIKLTEAFVAAGKAVESYHEYKVQEDAWVAVVDVCDGPWKKGAGQ